MDEPAGTTKVQLWTRAAAVYKFIAEASDMQLLGPNHKEANWTLTRGVASQTTCG